MELRSVAYNPTPALGMGGMQGMSGMPGMQGMAGTPMGGAHGMYQHLPPSGLVNLDVDADPGLVTLDLGGPMPCPPYGAPMMQQHCPMPCPPYEAPMMQHHCPMPAPTPTPTPMPAHEVYVVKKGDTVYKIAKRYGTTMQAIILANNLRNPDLIYPGQILLIPGSQEYNG